MVAYGLGIPPLIRELHQAHPGITQNWYADESRAGGTFEGNLRHLDDLMVKGPPRSYFLDPTKSILVVFPWNVSWVEAFFHGYGFQIVTGSHYLWGFVGTRAEKDCWLGEKAEGWGDSVATLAGVARWHPQTAYTGLQKFLHQEWAFVQRVTPDIGMEFQVAEDALRGIFLLHFFQGATKHIPGRAITGLPVKQAGIFLPVPTRTVGANWTESCVITGYLITAIRGTAKFRSGDHDLLMREGRKDIYQRHAEEAETALGEARSATSKLDA